MSDLKLSILICHLTRRKDLLADLLEELYEQMSDDFEEQETIALGECKLTRYTTPEIELLICTDNGETTTGDKRNHLKNAACGRYIVFIDDDDRISPNYLKFIFAGIKEGVDVITFKGFRYRDGVKDKLIHYSLNFERDTNNNAYYIRMPNHITPWKRELALQKDFPSRTSGEDSEWAKRMKGLAKTEYHINRILYYYMFNQEISASREAIYRREKLRLSEAIIETYNETNG